MSKQLRQYVTGTDSEFMLLLNGTYGYFLCLHKIKISKTCSLVLISTQLIIFKKWYIIIFCKHRASLSPKVLKCCEIGHHQSKHCHYRRVSDCSEQKIRKNTYQAKMSPEEPFCGQTLLTIGTYYKRNISGYIDMPTCILGSIFNLLNLVIFTRKNMRSQINLIFANLSLVDLLTLLTLIPFSWLHITERNVNIEGRSSYERALLFIICHDIMATFHFISAFLTVMLAIWRYIAVVHPFTGWSRCNMKTTRCVIAAVYIACVLLNIPMYLSRDITTTIKNNTIVYIPGFKRDSILCTVAFAIKGVLQCLLPSVLLPIFSFKLVVVLMARKESQEQSIPSSNAQNHEKKLKLKQQNDRSIVILLVVIVLFFITKVPSGILYLMFIIYGGPNSSHNVCFFGLRAIFSTLTTINMSVTFVLYYTMSQNFRITLRSLFKKDDIPFQNGNIYFVFSNTKKTDTCLETS
ncbi:probable G-protein coupled receptor 139 [Planococcus citri]|uniref:probable G-protein coupled receptor 139 n=1 Tax=Planococcus citri TaxID=170843 RepID=UPI0031FA2BB0